MSIKWLCHGCGGEGAELLCMSPLSSNTSSATQQACMKLCCKRCSVVAVHAYYCKFCLDILHPDDSRLVGNRYAI